MKTAPSHLAGFPHPLDLRSLIIDGKRVPRRGVVGTPFVFVSPTLGRRVVPVGFVTDFASVPRALWNVYPPDGDYTEAAVIHDWEYDQQTLTRAAADLLFLEGMRALGVDPATRRILYRAVRLGGGPAWEEHARRRAGLPPREHGPARRPANFHKARR